MPVQRNSRDENKHLKEGKVPEQWSENKVRQKDTDAKWVTHNGKDYFGYKNHIKADSKTKLVTGYKATTANIHDSEMLQTLLDKKKMAVSHCMQTALTAAKPLRKCAKEKTLKAGYMKKVIAISL